MLVTLSIYVCRENYKYIIKLDHYHQIMIQKSNSYLISLYL